MSSNNGYTLEVDSTEYAISLSRTGAQGSRGHSITNAYISGSHHLMLEVSDSAGNLIETLDAGSFDELIGIESLSDVTATTALADGDVLIYNTTENAFENHQLTTSKVLDIDNTNKADGALLLYNGTTEKYTATTNLNNENTTISGGSF